MMRVVSCALAMGLLHACCMGSSEEEAPPPSAPSAPVPPEPEVVPDLVVGAEPVIVHVPALPRLAFTVERPGEYQLDVRGAPMNAQLRLFAGQSVMMQAGGGESADAQILTFLDPGSYELQVGEWRSRELDALVSLTRLAPMTPVATLATDGVPAIVQSPAGATPREASVEVTLAVAVAGTYRIRARSPDDTRDAELALLLDGGLVQADSDSGDGTSAEIVRELAPGAYTLRVRDWRNREASIELTAAPGAI